MDSHPASLARFASNALTVVTFAVAVPSAHAGIGPAPLTWGLIIFCVGLGGAAMQSLAAAIWPRGAASSRDEQVRRTEMASHVFGYWVVLVVFLSFLAAVWTGVMSAEAAFYWLATPLAAAPPLWMAVAFLRGRAG